MSVPEIKNIYTMRDLLEGRIPPKNPPKNVLPENVVTLSSLKVKENAFEQPKREISKLDHSQNIKTIESEESEDESVDAHEILDRIENSMENVKRMADEIIKKSEQALVECEEQKKQYVERERKRMEEAIAFERSLAIPEKPLQEKPASLEKIKEDAVNPIESVSNSNKSWIAQLAEKLESAGEQCKKKASAFCTSFGNLLR